MEKKDIEAIKKAIKSEIDQWPAEHFKDESYADLRCVAMNIAEGIAHYLFIYNNHDEEGYKQFMRDCGCDEEYIADCFEEDPNKYLPRGWGRR